MNDIVFKKISQLASSVKSLVKEMKYWSEFSQFVMY